MKKKVTELSQYQIDDHRKIDQFGGRVILGWDMGLGKTGASTRYVYDRGLFPCVIVCPMVAKSVMVPELIKFIGDGVAVTINNGKVCPIPSLEKMFVIVNYDLVWKWEEEIKKLKPRSLIFDEAHEINNVNTKKNRSVRRLCSDIRNIQFLTGTPFKNTEEEMFTMLNILQPHIFSTPDDITNMVLDGSFNETLLQTCMIRRLKTKELKGLPPKHRHVVDISLTNQWEYEFAESSFKQWLNQQEDELSQTKKICAFAKLEKLKQLVTKGKVEGVRRWLESRPKQEGKTLVFFTHKQPLNALHEYFPTSSVVIRGGMTQRQREKTVKEFMTNAGVSMLLGNAKAAGKALTLIEADTVLMAEMPWTSVDCDQCEDRAWRRGQTRVVNAYYAIVKGTVEERIAKIIDRKRQRLSESIDGVGVKAKDVLMELLNEYRGEYV